MNPFNLDQQIGSLLEAWLTRETGAHCRFCNEWVGDLPPAELFCNEECKENWQTVQDARRAIGQRDMEQRGYD